MEEFEEEDKWNCIKFIFILCIIIAKNGSLVSLFFQEVKLMLVIKLSGSNISSLVPDLENVTIHTIPDGVKFSGLG